MAKKMNIKDQIKTMLLEDKKAMQKIGHPDKALVNQGSSRIVAFYYLTYNGVTMDTSIGSWLEQIATGKAPSLETILRALRTLRANDPELKREEARSN